MYLSAKLKDCNVWPGIRLWTYPTQAHVTALGGIRLRSEFPDTGFLSVKKCWSGNLEQTIVETFAHGQESKVSRSTGHSVAAKTQLEGSDSLKNMLFMFAVVTLINSSTHKEIWCFLGLLCASLFFVTFGCEAELGRLGCMIQRFPDGTEWRCNSFKGRLFEEDLIPVLTSSIPALMPRFRLSGHAY